MFGILNLLNYAAICIIVVIAVAGIWDEDYINGALLLSAFLGVYHILIALGWLIYEPRNKKLWLYIGATILFFTTWRFIPVLYFAIPLLTIYMSWLLYRKAK